MAEKIDHATLPRLLDEDAQLVGAPAGDLKGARRA